MSFDSKEKDALIRIILDLVEKVRLYQEKYGSEYLGGRPFQFILRDLKEMGIDISR